MSEKIPVNLALQLRSDTIFHGENHIISILMKLREMTVNIYPPVSVQTVYLDQTASSGIQKLECLDWK